MPCGIGLASLDKALLPSLDIKSIAAAAGDLGHHIHTLTVLDRHPFCLCDLDGRVAKTPCCDIPDPNIFCTGDPDKVPPMLLVGRVSFFLVADLFYDVWIKLRIASDVLDA